MYTCGLTVYARGHIGNFRTFVCLDVLRRTLKHLCGCHVRQVMNFTDVDDRTILGAAEGGHGRCASTPTSTSRRSARTPRRSAWSRWRRIAARDRRGQPRGDGRPRDGARAQRPHVPAATDPSTSRSRRCRATASWRASTTKACSRAPASTRTTTPKTTRATSSCGRRPDPGSRPGTSASGPAVPGWHLECSAMALRLLGEPPIDIHAGGIDLIFPHHENEIAQSEGATGRLFSRFWVHVEHLIVDNEKMSKSLGNVYTMQDVLDRGFRASALRYLLLSSALPQAAELHVGQPAAGGGVAAPARPISWRASTRSPAARRIRTRRRGSRSRARVRRRDEGRSEHRRSRWRSCSSSCGR